MPKMKAPRTPGVIPARFVYRSFSDVLAKKLKQPGLTAETTHALIDEAHLEWGLHPLGYTHAQHSAGDNWYLEDAVAFINIYQTGRNRGSVAVIMDKEDNPDQHMHVSIPTGATTTFRRVKTDIPGCAVMYRKYRTKAEFLDALAEADRVVRDNVAAEVFYTLVQLTHSLPKAH